MSRIVLVGYRVGEVKMGKCREPDPSFRYQLHNCVAPGSGYQQKRTVAAVAGPGRIACGSSLELPIARPRPDGSHAQSVVLGAAHRFGCKMPDKDSHYEKVFFEFAKKFFASRFQPLPAGADVTRKTWLDNAPYSTERVRQLREAGAGASVLEGKHRHCKSFIKAEGYDEYKYPRPINSYTDRAKYLIGGMCRAIDSVIFDDPAFVKHVPTNERPALLYRTFKDMEVLGSDYTSMESHHNGVYAEFGAWWMKYMAQNLPNSVDFCRIIDDLVLGTNYSKFKFVTISVYRKLMSGAFWTSSANTVLNLTINSFMFAISKVGIDAPLDDMVRVANSFKILVEGDDAIMEKFDIDTGIIAKLGLLFKFERFDSFGPASFCGIKTDVTTMQNMTDPRRVYAELGIYDSWWKDASDRVLLEMLRCKGLSILAGFPACPLVTELGLYAVRVTAHIRDEDALRHLNSYKKERLGPIWSRTISSATISDVSRATFASYYGISIDQQLSFEAAIRSCNSLVLPWFDLGFHADWFDYAGRYAVASTCNAENEWYPQVYPVAMPPTKRPVPKRGVLPVWNELDDSS